MKSGAGKRLLGFDYLLLTAITAVVFLPYATSLTYFMDDWYYIYDGVVAGPNIFHAMFEIDRPARGYFFDFYFSLFGPAPLPYHLGAFLWRVIAGCCALRLFKIIWPAHGILCFFSALLFAVYPGYSWWVSGIEYQPMIASLALQVFSFVATLEAIKARHLPFKLFLSTAAILSGWAYLALVEYAIGMEVFRFLCIVVVLGRTRGGESRPEKTNQVLRAWSWNALVPVGFLVWRLFLFENQRKTTDINLLLEKLKANPSGTFTAWMDNFGSSFLNAGGLTWYKQFLLVANDPSYEPSYAILVLIAAALLILIGVWGSTAHSSIQTSSDLDARTSSREAFTLGLLSLAFGIVPVVFANRFINLTFYSHYGLPVSLAAAILLVGLIGSSISFNNTGKGLLAAILVVAGLTHSLLAQRTVMIEKFLENFWWQASWRIPDIKPDTTLVTLYPNNDTVAYGLGLDELVNLIYFPESQAIRPIQFPVSALMPIDSDVELILSSANKKSDKYRVHKKIYHYDNILILVQPAPDACVRIIGGDRYLLSDADPENIGRIAAYSNIDNIRLQTTEHIPPGYAFGPEPGLEWCYLFEKAELAVQRLDWERAAELGDDAITRGMYPTDLVEWFPFIQAYSMTGDGEKLKLIAMQTAGDPTFREQICKAMQIQDTSMKPSLEIDSLVRELFCT